MSLRLTRRAARRGSLRSRRRGISPFYPNMVLSPAAD